MHGNLLREKVAIENALTESLGISRPLIRGTIAADSCVDHVVSIQAAKSTDRKDVYAMMLITP